MKRLAALLLVVCMAFNAALAMAENGFYGNMEVVRCREWVSLRAKPSTSVKRLAKVPLGAVVSECRQHGDGWIYAVYGECAGYIQEQYLQICEGMSVCSAMLVTGCEEAAELYGTIGALEPEGFLPENVIVRNCAVMASGRAYVEYGSQRGYVSAEYVTPYSELLHFPGQITLCCNLIGAETEGPAPALKVADQAAFPLAEYEYTEYDYTEYEQVAADIPRAEFVLYSDTEAKNVHLFSASLRNVDDQTGEMVFDFSLEHIQHRMEPEHPLLVAAVLSGDVPNVAVGYEDWTGAYHFAFVEISGEDGSFLLREF